MTHHATDTEPTLRALTADDVKALRTADRIAVHLRSRECTLTAIRELDGKVAGPFSRPREDVERPIHVAHPTAETAFFLVYKWSGALSALRLLVRVGDELVFRAFQNNNQYMETAGLNHDVLVVTIRRAGKTYLHELELASSNCPDNSARAIRSTGVNQYSIA